METAIEKTIAKSVSINPNFCSPRKMQSRKALKTGIVSGNKTICCPGSLRYCFSPSVCSTCDIRVRIDLYAKNIGILSLFEVYFFVCQSKTLSRRVANMLGEKIKLGKLKQKFSTNCERKRGIL